MPVNISGRFTVASSVILEKVAAMDFAYCAFEASQDSASSDLDTIFARSSFCAASSTEFAAVLYPMTEMMIITAPITPASMTNFCLIFI